MNWLRSFWPLSFQYWRANFKAVSIASDPPDEKKTLLIFSGLLKAHDDPKPKDAARDVKRHGDSPVIDLIGMRAHNQNRTNDRDEECNPRPIEIPHQENDWVIGKKGVFFNEVGAIEKMHLPPPLKLIAEDHSKNTDEDGFRFSNQLGECHEGITGASFLIGSAGTAQM